MSLLREATSVEQYHHPEMDWASEGHGDSPARRIIKRAINLRPDEVEGKSVLDVGCGTGWFLQECLNSGAKRATGIEPSKFAELAQKNIPDAEIFEGAFQDFDHKDALFDLVSFIMVTEHLDNMKDVLSRASELLNDSGGLIILTGGFEAFQTKRKNTIVTKETLIEGKEVVVRSERLKGYGTTIDILRSKDYWHELIEDSPLRLVDEDEVIIDEDYVRSMGKSEEILGMAVFRLFRLSK